MPFPQVFNPFKVSMNGQPLAMEHVLNITRVTVTQDLNLPGYFELELVGSDSGVDATQWIDDQIFAPGNEVKIEFTDHEKTDREKNVLMIGIITGLEPSFSCNRPPNMIIRGYDYLYRLQRSLKTQTYLQQKDSQIVTQMAAEVGLVANVQDSEVPYDYLIQPNQTNLHFLQARTEQIGYTLYVEDKTLFFQPVTIRDSSLTFGLGDDLLEFTPRLSAIEPSTEVVIQGWDFKKKQAVSATAKSNNSAPFGSTITTVANRPPMDKSEAQQQAEAQVQQETLKLIQGEGVAWGQAEIKIGKTITLEGLGSRFSGAYYVTGVTHQYDAEGQFYTHFRVRSNQQ
jgi:uncharacterized protein